MARILILGGTAEARLLAERLAARAGLDVTLSLAGRTASPARPPVPVRVGGFGGVAGLADYLMQEKIDALVDATHPYARTISAHAVTATQQIKVPLLALRRPPWTAVAGDRWTEVADVRGALQAIGEKPSRVFVALGRQEVAPLVEAPQHSYVIRTLEPVDLPLALPRATYITGRGPFSEANDHALLAAHWIEFVVAKNSGGSATFGKIAAARSLGVEVVILRRPPLPDAPAVATVDEALAWLNHTLTSPDTRGA